MIVGAAGAAAVVAAGALAWAGTGASAPARLSSASSASLARSGTVASHASSFSSRPVGASVVSRTSATVGHKYPVVYSGASAAAYAAAHPGTSPAGSNDWSCKPSAAHPYPVVLVHGTIENMTYNWYTLSPLLADEGYCVFALNYGQEPGIHVGLPGAAEPGGVGPIPASARQLKGFINKVLAATGASKVDIVGHSQGGMMPRYYLKFLGGASKVDKLVALAPSNHGTTADGIAQLPGGTQLLTAALGQSVRQQIAGSAFLRKLNAGGDTVPGPAYTVIETAYDEVVTPYTSAFLSGPHVTNILLQDQCAADGDDHLAISFDAIAMRDVLNALDPSHAVAPGCHPTLPLNGG
ncbi:MAG: alpha/beta fold hydrolase [Nocardiopsaceae bacterium]|nr:alpha/beta fold hydrolase [Nocardiopsaceae bacterium]